MDNDSNYIYYWNNNGEMIKASIDVGFPIDNVIIPWDEDDDSCKHDWKPYIGFTESFKYCIKCDERRELDGE